jgi:hypothetical protein
MTITIPSGQLSHRFMRYVRPPVKEAETLPQLFPLPRRARCDWGSTRRRCRPRQRGTWRVFSGATRLTCKLLVPAGEEAPTAWTDVLHEPLVRQVGFTSIEKAGRLIDTVQFWVTTESERERSSTRAHFFDVYQQLDAPTAPPSADPLTLHQRHHAAAYAAAAAAVGIDAIVTNAPTAGRCDVADNDVVPSVTRTTPWRSSATTWANDTEPEGGRATRSTPSSSAWLNSRAVPYPWIESTPSKMYAFRLRRLSPT